MCLWEVILHIRGSNNPGAAVDQAIDSVYARHGTCKMRSEEHTSELQSLMRISYAVFCLKKKTNKATSNKVDHDQQTRQPNTPQQHRALTTPHARTESIDKTQHRNQR